MAQPPPPPPPPAPSSYQIPPPLASVAYIPDALLEDIFLRLPTAVDLARASTACAAFRRVIADHSFLRRYRAIHPPPLVGMLHDPFIPAQPPHPSAVGARGFADFDFSCSSFLPSAAGRTWTPIHFFDGRVLLAGAPVSDESGRAVLVGAEECDFQYRRFVRDLTVCDPVHRRYILLPAVPGDLKALVHKPDLLDLESFLAPGEDEEDPLSFRVMCLLQCRMNLLLLVFSSLDGQWSALTYDQWSARDGLSNRQFVHRCFCWHLCVLNKVLLLDPRTMEFSTVNLTFQQWGATSFVIVEAAEGMLGMVMVTQGYDEDSPDYSYRITYSILRNNQWHLEKVVPLPVKRAVIVGVSGGYLLIEAVYTTPSQEMLKFGCFSVDIKTLRVELFAQLSELILPGLLYAGFPPSLCAPTI